MLGQPSHSVGRLVYVGGVNAAAVDSTRELLEPAVAGLESAVHEIERDTRIGEAERELAIEAIEQIRTRLVRQWFGSERGQDVLF